MNRNARFWVRYRGSWVKLTMKPETTLETYESEPTDEGFSYEHVRYRYDGEEVTCEVANGGKDCDGRIDCYTDYACMVTDLRGAMSYHNEVPIPKWTRLQTSVYDQYAAMMGY